MDTETISKCTRHSFSEQISFPKVVRQLAEAGVERYIIDLAGQQKLSFGINGEAHSEKLDFDKSPIAQNFNQSEVKQAIIDSQQQKIRYREFLKRIISAGCSHYEVFINGRKAVYFGRDGSSHTELFPEAT